MLLSLLIFYWLLFYFIFIYCHIWSYHSKKSFQEWSDHDYYLVYLCIFPRFGIFSMTVYECFSTFISQTTSWRWVNNITSSSQQEKVMQRENEWLLKTTMSQCRATQRSWSPNAQPMSDLLWHSSRIMGEVRPETHAAQVGFCGSAGQLCYRWRKILAVRFAKNNFKTVFF